MSRLLQAHFGVSKVCLNKPAASIIWTRLYSDDFTGSQLPRPGIKRQSVQYRDGHDHGFSGNRGQFRERRDSGSTGNRGYRDGQEQGFSGNRGQTGQYRNGQNQNHLRRNQQRNSNDYNNQEKRRVSSNQFQQKFDAIPSDFKPTYSSLVPDPREENYQRMLAKTGLNPSRLAAQQKERDFVNSRSGQRHQNHAANRNGNKLPFSLDFNRENRPGSRQPNQRNQQQNNQRRPPQNQAIESDMSSESLEVESLELAADSPQAHQKSNRHERKLQEKAKFSRYGEEEIIAVQLFDKPQRRKEKKVVIQEKIVKKVALPNSGSLRVDNLRNILGVKLWNLQRAMDRVGLEDTSPGRLLTIDDAALIAMELGFEPEFDDDEGFDIYPSVLSESSNLSPRPPICGIFGHVDHGKTTLLDALRSTSVAQGEAGGITQHIGAFQVPIEAAKSTITFLDTPGHAAFSAMRSRGIDAVDVVVIVVAADDGVKPQTKEVIQFAKDAGADLDGSGDGTGIGVVVAITKVDKHDADVDAAKNSLLAAGVVLEDFGGSIPSVEISALSGKGLPELVETIATVAEMKELVADKSAKVEGKVLESRVSKGVGNVATIVVTNGTLTPHTPLVAGTSWCRVRSLGTTDKPLQCVYPGEPVEVTGWKTLPTSGDVVLEASSEEEAKKAIDNRIRRKKLKTMWDEVEVINEKRRNEALLEDIRREAIEQAKKNGLSAGAQAVEGQKAVDEMMKVDDGQKQLRLIVKADVWGTVEAVIGAIDKIGNDEAISKVVFSGVGDVKESDIEMARTIQGRVIAFNVNVPAPIKKLAAAPPPVAIDSSPIIYRLVDSVRDAVSELLPKEIQVRVHGEAIVQQVFSISVKGRKDGLNIAGSKVQNGILQKARKVRVMRNGESIFTGTINTLKQLKKDVTEIPKGVECGIALDGFVSFLPEDVIQSIEEVEVARKL